MKETNRMLLQHPIETGWRAEATAGPVPDALSARLAAGVPAAVPGVVHTDLLAAGLIPDPYLDDNESALAWIGLVDWTYRTVFEAPAEPAERHELVFDGVDTVATIALNGTVLAEVANQHRTYRFDATGLLRPGANDLVVAFRSPVKHANAKSLEYGARPRPYPMPYEAIRKSACSFGWDWGIATYTSGLWRPVRLESWSTARLGRVLVRAEPAGDGGSVVADVEIDTVDETAGLVVALTVSGPGQDAPVSVQAAVDGGRASIRAELDAVSRWWPAGYGDQPLYDATVTLSHDGDALDETARRVGFRTIEWDTEPDADGTPFQLVVNGVPVFVKGVNWIPDDAFPSRVDRARYTARLTQAKDANLNLIRVWGGGVYEADDFYETCDELGLLTWQDFLFACAAYPEDDELFSEVAAEARDNVARLAHHASLALFTGNNENIWGYEDWGWQPRLDGKTWGARYYYELLPAVVAELAPDVAYAPGSPFSPHGEHPNDERHGTVHLWEQWNRQDWPTYRDHTPRFVAEFGWQGPPTWTTLTRSISDDPLTPESPGMVVHQKAIDGNAKLDAGLVAHYRAPRDMETWHWAMQLNQANAVGAALDWFRSRAPRTSGAVVWQLNDCWPVTSWAAVDGDGRAKPLLHAIRNSFAPRRVTVQPRPEGLAATVLNEHAAAWEGTLEFALVGYDGSVRANASAPVSVPPFGAATVSIPDAVLASGASARDAVLTASLDGTRGEWFFTEPRDSALTAPALTATLDVRDDETVVRITADVLVRDLTLLVDKLDPEAMVDTGLLTLLPGETAVFRVRGVAGLSADDVLRPGVARHGNELVAR